MADLLVSDIIGHQFEKLKNGHDRFEKLKKKKEKDLRYDVCEIEIGHGFDD